MLLFGIKYTKRVSLNILEDIHNWLVSLSRNLDICYIVNHNIRCLHLFKDALHLLEYDRKILAKNFVFYLNNFLFHVYKLIAPIQQ